MADMTANRKLIDGRMQSRQECFVTSSNAHPVMCTSLMKRSVIDSVIVVHLILIGCASIGIQADIATLEEVCLLYKTGCFHFNLLEWSYLWVHPWRE